jgi:hypothetical protein
LSLRTVCGWSAKAAITHVCDGSTQWFYSHQLGASQSKADGSVGGGVLTPLLRPLSGLAVLWKLELVGEVMVAGHEGVRISALPRPSMEFELPFHSERWLARGADECEFVLDRERGLLLRSESRLEAEPFSVIEFTELELDRRLDPQVFVFSPPPGEQVRTPEDSVAGQTGLPTLEQVVARASFTVYVPGMIWPRATMHVHHSPSQERHQLEENVSLTYFDTGAGRHLSLMERAPESELLPDGEWESAELDGVEAFVGTPTALPFQSSERGIETPLTVRMLRGGTQIEIQGWGLERAELLGLVRSLEPARSGPPPGFH